MKAFSVHSQGSISAPRKYKSEIARGLAKVSSPGQLTWEASDMNVPWAINPALLAFSRVGTNWCQASASCQPFMIGTITSALKVRKLRLIEGA